MSFRALFSMIIGALVAAACDSGTADHGSIVETRPYSCPSWRCGLNAAEVNGHSLQELNLDGLLNQDGARMVGWSPPPFRFGYSLSVEGDELVFRKGPSALRGDQIVGAIIWVQLPGGLSVPVTIADYQAVPSWAAGHPAIAAYTLQYPELQEVLGVKNVCAGDVVDPLFNVVTVLGGERYDAQTKSVIAGQSRWFTIACAGSAAAKLKLLGYGPQSSATTPARRQATLKMITADYCGGGHSYTENGTEVLWANADGSVAPDAGTALGEVEAIWTASGALCLDATRIADTEVACNLPTCVGLDLSNGEWITHVPAE